MTSQDFIIFIETKGFKEYQSWKESGRTFGLRGKGDKFHCECNERPPDIHITIHELYVHDTTYLSCDIGVIGQNHDQWADLKVYALKLDEAHKEFDKIIKRLKRMWEVYCETDI